MTKLLGQLFTGAGALASVFAMCAAGLSPTSTVAVILFFALPGLVLFGVGLWLQRKAREIDYERYVDREMQYQQQFAPQPEPFRGDVTPARGIPVALPPSPQQQYQYPQAQQYQPAPQIVYVQQPLSKRDQQILKRAKQEEFNRGCAALVVLIIVGIIILSGGRALSAIGDMFNTLGVLMPSGNRAAENQSQSREIRTLSEARPVLTRIPGVLRVDSFNIGGNKAIVGLKVTDDGQSIATAQTAWRSLDNATPSLDGAVFLIYDDDEIFTYGYDEGGIWLTEDMRGVVEIPR